MNLSSQDYSGSVVAIGALARQLQSASANNQNPQKVYELATNIMLECQRVRECTQREASPRTIGDYIKRVFK